MNARADSLKHWEYFLAVVEEGGMTAAADRLGVTQSPVSQAIRRLEDHVGTRLVTRSAAGVTPTDAGRRLLPQVRVLVRDAEALAAATDRLTDTTSGLRVGVVASAPPRIAYRLSAELNARASAAVSTTASSTATSAALVDAVGVGELDVAVVEDPCPTADLLRGQLHEIPRRLAGMEEPPARWSALSGSVLLDNTRLVSPAAADRLDDALFSLGLSVRVEAWETMTGLATRLGSDGALALVPEDFCSLWPSVTAPAVLAQRLRCVVHPDRPDGPDGTDLRATVDRALRHALRERAR